jgi:hypothetical protein
MYHESVTNVTTRETIRPVSGFNLLNLDQLTLCKLNWSVVRKFHFAHSNTILCRVRLLNPFIQLPFIIIIIIIIIIYGMHVISENPSFQRLYNIYWVKSAEYDQTRAMLMQFRITAAITT